MDMDIRDYIILCTAGNVYWKDVKGRYLGCNLAFSKIARLASPRNIKGKSDEDLFSDFFGGEGLKKIIDLDREVMEQDVERVVEEVGIDELGREAFYLTKKMPLKNNSGDIIGLMGTSIDITNYKILEEELKKTKASEARFKALSTMGGMIAHELRTPLTALKGSTMSIEKFLPVLLEAHERCVARGEMEPIRKDLLAALGRSIPSMNSLIKRCQETISAILTGIHYSTGVKKPVLQELTLRVLVEKALADYPMEPTERAQLLSVEVEDYLVQGSEQVIIHVLHNLLKNAFHIIHEEGRGSVCIYSEKASDGIHLMVEDTAKGIKEEQLAHIFDAFYTTKEEAAQSIGLGLYFCKMALERIGAEIRCESEFGQYTRFIIVLPWVK